MTFGPAWGHDGKTYNGKDLRQFASLVAGGPAAFAFGVPGAGDFVVSAQSTPNATVKVAAGRGFIPASGAGLFGCYGVQNDGDVNSPAFTATGADPRTDLVILRVDGSGNVAVQIVAGTPGPGTPPPPAVTGDNWLTLAEVRIPASTSNITNGMIVDARTLARAGAARLATILLGFYAPSVGEINCEPDTGDVRKWNGTVWEYLVEQPKSWSPAWGAALSPPSIGNGTLIGRRHRSAKRCWVDINLTAGTTTSGGTGDIQFSLPFAAVSGRTQILKASLYVASQNQHYWGFAHIPPGGTTCQPFMNRMDAFGTAVYARHRNTDGTGAPGTGIPLVPGNFPITNGSILIIEGDYEMATA